MTETASTEPREPGAEPDHGWGAAPPYSLGSVDNALRLIRALDEHGELRVYEAAELLGVARSTAHRLLSTLAFRGFAEQRDGSHVYRPGPALAEAGLRAISRLDLRQVARPQLRTLSEETGETVHLVVLEGNGARFVDGVESTQPLRVGLRIGMVLPAHATAAGKAILAALPPEQVRDLYPRGVQALTGRTLRTLEDIQRHLTGVARAGHATNHRESADDVAAVGVVIRNPARAPVAALAVAAPAERLQPARIPLIAIRMHRTSHAITDAMTPPLAPTDRNR
ncbi:IclR family transcriptional regulator [Streptomyces sp. B6B3]|uniref:IclR family transcriptional regulator n=1 Tax=Streptomyces sp. B6B3 TaxID=3153570 RepID=UPI00325C9010